MAFHPVPHCIGLVFEGVGPDGILRHIMHARSAGTSPTLPELQAAADAAAGWVFSDYKHCWPAAVSCLSVLAKDESVVDGAQVTGTGFFPMGGVDSGSPLPSNVTLAVSLRTALGGRSHRGRIYTWVPSSDRLTATGNFQEAFVLSTVVHIQALMTVLAAAGVPLAIKSNVLSQVTPVTAILAEDFNSDSQRRRLAGRGR